ncbi:MAG: hypothetical protein HFI05_09670 [Lachnospiraceae bacterium]|jgi:DNA-binding MarR family transcriptional regulator|nr:hypothetical protein [Lachnospiraceae bacterium]
MEEATEKLSITHTEIEIIMFLFNNPDYDTAKDISELRKFPKSCVSKAVDDLIKKDYLESFIDISDRRILHLKLKEPSKPVIKLSQKIRTHFLEIICQGIDDREKEELLKILNTISINVKEALKEKC